MSIMAKFVEPPKHESHLVAFYRNKKPDDKGRFITEIWQWDHHKLEEIHDYIQWLFPLPEESMVSDAPLIDADVFAAFHSSPELQSGLKKSFVKMLDFYGLRLADDLDENELPVIIKAPNYNDRRGNWLVNYNHNHLRISRILRSLRVLGLEFEATAFYKQLSSIIYDRNRQVINSRSAEYWRRSAERPLHWAPDMSEDECGEDRGWEKGTEFLKDYERIKMARDLQQQHDVKKALEEKKEMEFQATKAHIAAVEANRRRKLAEANLSPQSRGINSQDSRISEFQLEDKEAVVAKTRELTPESQEVAAEKDTEAHSEPELIEENFSEFGKVTHDGSKLMEQGCSRFGEATQDESKIVEQKVLETVEQSIIHQIPQYQLLAPRQP